MTCHPDSHVDHLPKEVLAYILERFAARNEFFKETIELPAELPEIANDLYGPVCGDEPVREDEVNYVKRAGRDWLTRVVARPSRKTRQCTVIAGPHSFVPCVLYTAYGGPEAQREPGDPSMQSFDDQVAARRFWAHHALVLESAGPG